MMTALAVIIGLCIAIVILLLDVKYFIPWVVRGKRKES